MAEAKQSKCWTCKFGICVKESGEEHFMHPAPPPEGNEFDNAFNDQEPNVPMHDHVIQTEAVKTICFWRAKDIPHAPPMMMAFVKECNRYEYLSSEDR